MNGTLPLIITKQKWLFVLFCSRLFVPLQAVINVYRKDVIKMWYCRTAQCGQVNIV